MTPLSLGMSVASVTATDSWTLAFGSCHNQRLPAPVLSAAARHRPDVFAWLGDNLYNDINEHGGLCEPIACDSYWVGLWGRFLEALTMPVRLIAPQWLERTVAHVVHRGRVRCSNGRKLWNATTYAVLSHRTGTHHTIRLLSYTNHHFHLSSGFCFWLFHPPPTGSQLYEQTRT